MKTLYYKEYDLFPSHSLENLPCIVKINIVNKYYLYQKERREQIPNLLGKWIQNQLMTIKETKENKQLVPLRFRNIFKKETYQDDVA